ncbi:Uncharacterised protein [Mycobacteroides abscessus subsp. abscessus]|nr:Uncharacterised protein [Mycobacteroides abscessus subsp. abscessus]SKT66934.1 Uncharacterised protein [Mycobacteroides abscessus subsp. abscessus]
MNALLISLTFAASNPLSTGRSPPSNASRSSAGWVCSLSSVPPSGSLCSSPGPAVISRYRSPTRFSYLMMARLEL